MLRFFEEECLFIFVVAFISFLLEKHLVYIFSLENGVHIYRNGYKKNNTENGAKKNLKTRKSFLAAYGSVVIYSCDMLPWALDLLFVCRVYSSVAWAEKKKTIFIQEK